MNGPTIADAAASRRLATWHRRRVRLLRGGAPNIRVRKAPAGATSVTACQTAMEPRPDMDTLLAFMRDNYIVEFDIDPLTRVVSGARLVTRAAPCCDADAVTGQSAA